MHLRKNRDWMKADLQGGALEEEEEEEEDEGEEEDSEEDSEEDEEEISKNLHDEEKNCRPYQ
jgi:hypothetical protein